MTKKELTQKKKVYELQYKEIRDFLQTDICKKCIETFKEKGYKIEKEIFEALQKREKTEGEKSQTDKLYDFYNFLGELYDFIKDGEKANYLCERILEQKENVLTNILNNTEEGNDLPLYTKIDLLKQKRIDYLNIQKRFSGMAELIANDIDKLKKELKSDKQEG